MSRTGTSIALAALFALTATAQQQPMQPPPSITPTEEPEGSTGFSREALQEWQLIEKEIADLEDKPEQLLSVLEAQEKKELRPETRQIIAVVKTQVLTGMIDDVFRSAETEADILKAKELVLRLVKLIPDESDRNAALNEVDIRFADPAALLQQVLQARTEQNAGDEQLSRLEPPEPTEDDLVTIGKLVTEIESMSNTEQKLKHLHACVKNATPAVRDWLHAQMTELLIGELNSIQENGVNTVEDILKIKEIFGKIIHYCSPENEKKQKLKRLEEEFADPEALLRRIKEQEQFMDETEEEDDENEDENPQAPGYEPAEDEDAEEVTDDEPAAVALI